MVWSIRPPPESVASTRSDIAWPLPACGSRAEYVPPVPDTSPGACGRTCRGRGNKPSFLARFVAMTVQKIIELEPQLANCRDYWLAWGEADRLDGDLTYYRSGLAHPQLNGVLRLQSSEQVGQFVDRAAGRLGGVPWMWWVGPDSARGVADRLADHGAVRVGAMPIMAVELDRVVADEGPAGLKIETVEGAEALSEWVQAYGPSFGVAPELTEDALRIEAGRADASSVVRIIGRLDGQAVGTALMLDAHGVAGIYVVATAEAHRRQGIGAALTAAALQAGRDRGLRIGTLQASGLGAPVYQRMGFEKVAEYQLFQLPVS